mgnify:CR=1 FL=1
MPDIILIFSIICCALDAPISTLVCDLAINLINFYFIIRSVPGKIDVGRSFLRPFCAAAISVGASKLIYGAAEAKFGEGAFLTLGTIALCALIYAILCLVFKVIRFDEIGKIRQRKAEKIHI